MILFLAPTGAQGVKMSFVCMSVQDIMLKRLPKGVIQGVIQEVIQGVISLKKALQPPFKPLCIGGTTKEIIMDRDH